MSLGCSASTSTQNQTDPDRPPGPPQLKPWRHLESLMFISYTQKVSNPIKYVTNLPSVPIVTGWAQALTASRLDLMTATAPPRCQSFPICWLRRWPAGRSWSWQSPAEISVWATRTSGEGLPAPPKEVPFTPFTLQGSAQTPLPRSPSSRSLPLSSSLCLWPHTLWQQHHHSMLCICLLVCLSTRLRVSPGQGLFHSYSSTQTCYMLAPHRVLDKQWSGEWRLRPQRHTQCKATSTTCLRQRAALRAALRAIFICCWPPHPRLRPLGTASRISFGSHFPCSRPRVLHGSDCAREPATELGPTKARLSHASFPSGDRGELRDRPGTRSEPVILAGATERSLSLALAVSVGEVRCAHAAWLPRSKSLQAPKGDANSAKARRREQENLASGDTVLSTGSSHAGGCHTTRLLSDINQ